MAKSLRSLSFPELQALDDSRQLVGSEDEQEGSEDEQELYYDLYKSPCDFKASNDEFSVERIDSFDLCDLKFYGGCFDGDAGDFENSFLGDDDMLELNVDFDYEIFYRNGANAARTIQHVEGAMLEHLAAVVGLNKCKDPVRRQRRRVQSGQSYLHDFTNEQLEMLMGISNEPLDFKNPDFDECIVPVAASKAAKATCVPVTGIIRIYLKNNPELDADDKTSLQSGMLRLIRWGMQQDLYVFGNAQHVSFIGTRINEDDFDSVGRPGTDIVQSQKSGNDQRHTAGIIVGSLAAVVLLVAIFLFAVARPRRSSDEDSTDGAPPVVTESVADTIGPTFEEKESQEYAHWLRKQSAPAPPASRSFKTASNS